MGIRDIIQEKVSNLPSEKMIEVLDFVTCIEEQENLRVREEVFSDQEFETRLDDCFGRWKDEIDGIKYTNQLRNTWRGPFGGAD